LVTIEKIEPAKENIYNNNFKRIVSVKLTGSARLPSTGSGRELVERNSPKSTGKTAQLRAEDLRLAIDPTGAKIQSASCTIVSLKDEFMFVAGCGFGHGVGLCQYGARQMARQGKTAQEILNFYYPNSRIKILY
jgi:stage II sporulation protein D